MQIPLVIGIAGLARCGKDTLAAQIRARFERMKVPCVHLSIAKPVKEDLDPLLKKTFNISAFTQNNTEKEFIRPLLVCYATDLGRKKDKDIWLKRIAPEIELNQKKSIISIISDVRFENEVKFIKDLGGIVIHITRSRNKPGSLAERINDPLVKKLADYKMVWKSFTPGTDSDGKSFEQETCFYHVSRIFNKYGWNTYDRHRSISNDEEGKSNKSTTNV
jgi:hypothetical protein